MIMKKYYIYILSSISGTLYTGMTNDLQRRIWEHKEGNIPGFTKKYNAKKLVYFEDTRNVNEAIAREKQIKGWVRRKKIDLVESVNSKWEDLSRKWFEDQDSLRRSNKNLLV